MSFETIDIASVKAGDSLPEVAIALSPALIVGGALASQDFTPVHHDKAAAQATGMPDVFMNILTTNGLVGRYVTDWAGMDASIRNVAIKLGGPNVPGDTMKLTGTVRAVDAGAGRVEIDVLGRNSWGNHVEGTVTIELPSRSA